MKSTKPLVAVDCDTLLFASTAACEERSIKVMHEPTGKSKEFKNRTEFKELMNSREKEITPDYKIIDQQFPQPLENALQIVKQRTEKILDNFSDCEVILCAGDVDNFRMKLPYPTKYKKNRDTALRPLLLKEVHSYFKRKYKAVVAQSHEVDDEVAVLAYGALRQGREGIVISPDGDSRQFDGLKLGKYDYDYEACFPIEFMSPIRWTDGEFDSYGFPWAIMQAAVGDATDGLNPTYLAKKRYGEKGFYNEVKDMRKPEELALHLIKKYKEWFPSEFEYTPWEGRLIKADWKFMLNLYWKGTTMKRDRDKEPDFLEFIKEKEQQYGFDGAKIWEAFG